MLNLGCSNRRAPKYSFPQDFLSGLYLVAVDIQKHPQSYIVLNSLFQQTDVLAREGETAMMFNIHRCSGASLARPP